MNYLNDSIVIPLLQGGERLVACRSFGQWAVHKAIALDDTKPYLRWNITHIPTGLAAFGATSLSLAVQAAKRLEPYQINGEAGKGDATATALLCAGLRVWQWCGDVGYSCEDLPDIAAWTREEAAP